MAADQTAARIGHLTLTASTVGKINLTGKVRDTVEIIHHGDATNVIYFTSATTEAGLTAIAAVKQDEIEVILPGERLVISSGPNVSWWAFYSGGTPTVSVNAIQ